MFAKFSYLDEDSKFFIVAASVCVMILLTIVVSVAQSGAGL